MGVCHDDVIGRIRTARPIAACDRDAQSSIPAFYCKRRPTFGKFNTNCAGAGLVAHFVHVPQVIDCVAVTGRHQKGRL
jgi:hypothetical protein